MPCKRNRRKAASPQDPASASATEETGPVPGPAVAKNEDLEASASHLALAEGQKKRKVPVADDRQHPWSDEHHAVLAEFWINHPIFYDKTQQHSNVAKYVCELSAKF